MGNKGASRSWIVAIAAMCINLALGILYAWSVIKGGIPEHWGWSNADKALPYSVACFCFALAMIPAGRLQDRIGPRWVATMGGVFVGVGCIIAALAGSSLLGFIIGFGIFGGVGIGFGYASATPPAIKWFPPHKTGVVTGIVVAGFGLASVYIAPLGKYLLATVGISRAMLAFGIAFLAVVILLAQLLTDPPPGHIHVSSGTGKTAPAATVNLSWKEMLGTAQFYILWLIYFSGAAAGLTFISFCQDLGKKSLGELAFIAVAVLAVGNAGGRVIAGLISDKIGRQRTLLFFLVLQAFVVFVLYWVRAGSGWPLMLLLVALLGASYGSNLSLFPSAAKDYFGLKNFGVNYGVLFTAWGAAGLIMPWVNGRIKDTLGTNDLTFFIIIATLLVSAGLTFASTSVAKRNELQLVRAK